MIAAIRERWSRWRGNRAGTAPISFQTTSSINFGPGIGNQPSHERLLRESLGIADTATRAIATRISTLNPQVKVRRRIRDGTVVEETIDDHPLKMLLDRPHPNLTRAQLNRLTAQWIITVGEAYWLKVGSLLGVPVELHPIPPTNIYPIVTNSVVEEYEVINGSGRKQRLPANTVVRFYFPDPENIWASEGYLGPEAVTTDSLKFAGQHLRRRYENNATPQSVLETSAEATQFSPEEVKRFASEWTRKYHTRRGRDTDSPAILPMGYKLVEMAMQSGADITPLLEFWRDEQLMGFFTPRSILGQVVSGDRSSAETNQYVFDRHAVKPVANLIADGCTLQLAPDFDSNIFVEFEEFVSDDKRFILEQETADLVNKVRSVNQVREDRGWDVTDWGEAPVAKIGEIPYDPEGFRDLEPDIPSALGDEEERSRSARSRKARVDYFTPDAEWLRQIAREKKFVPAFLRAMRTILRDQEKSVLQKLEEQANTPRARAINPELLIDPEEWGRLFAVRVEPIRQAAFLEIAAATVEGLGGEGAEFIFTDVMRNILREQGARLVRQVNATTGKRLAQAVTEAEAEIIAAELEGGVAVGQATDQIAKRIEGVFRVRRKEARTIARTEILKASQSAQLESYKVMEVEQKQWNTMRDTDVRDAHSYAEGQIRAVGDPFDLGGEPADAPGIGAGGGALSAANSINCRCFLTPVIG